MPKRDTGLDARLRLIRSTQSEDLLIEGLSDPSPVVAEAAAKRITQPRAAEPLARTYLRLDETPLDRDPGCWARMAILEALGRLEAPEAEEPARRAVRSVQVEVVSGGPIDTATGLRVAAAALLANLRPPGALIDLAWLLFDTTPNAPCSRAEAPFAKLAARRAAARAIGALGDPAGAAVLGVRLAFPGDELPDVLADCMDALAALREPRTVELLTPWLGKSNPYLIAAAATAMAAADGVAAVPVLVAHLEQAPRDARASLVYAVASVRADVARKALVGLVSHPDQEIQKAAREMTGTAGE